MVVARSLFSPPTLSRITLFIHLTFVPLRHYTFLTSTPSPHLVFIFHPSTQQIKEDTKDLLGVVGKHAASGSMVDVQDLFFRFTFDTICRVAFGRKPGALLSENGLPILHAFDRCQKRLFKRCFAPAIIWKTQRFFNIGPERQFRADVSLVNEYAYNVVRERLKTDPDVIRKHPDLLSQHVLHGVEHNMDLDERNLRDVILSYMIAGRDTTASMLTWCIYRLHRHRDWQSAIQQEIDSVLVADEKKEVKADESDSLSYELLRNLPKLDAFLMEVLRMHPPVPTDSKYAINADVLPDGTVVPPGSKLAFNACVINRVDPFWQDPDEFKVERWLGDAPKPTNFEFLTFNAGHRTCLGKYLALMEAKM